MNDLDELPRARVIETRLKPSDKLSAEAQRAMARVADEGGSPREQADAARAAEGTRLAYLPHEGRREREKRLARMAKAAAKRSP